MGLWFRPHRGGAWGRKKAKARRRMKYRKVEAALIDLESFEVKDSRAVITIKNVDARPATIIRVNLWKVLKKPVIKSGLLSEKIMFFERVDRKTRPNVFTVSFTGFEC